MRMRALLDFLTEQSEAGIPLRMPVVVVVGFEVVDIQQDDGHVRRLIASVFPDGGHHFVLVASVEQPGQPIGTRELHQLHLEQASAKRKQVAHAACPLQKVGGHQQQCHCRDEQHGVGLPDHKVGEVGNVGGRQLDDQHAGHGDSGMAQR